MSNPTVAEYIVRRLSVLGIDKAFGVPSDYAFPIADAIEASPDIDWVGCTNELNAAYAVDGYARLKGAGLLCAAYGVGELSLVNGLMASRAHRVPVFFLTGQPSRRITKQRLVSKHTLGDGVYGNFEPIIEAACCAKAVISPDSAIAEMERVIREALSQSQPAYIVVLHDAQDVPVIGTPVTGEPLSRVKRQVSVDAELEGALTAIVNQLKNAHNPVILPTALTARYGLRHKIGQFIEAANIPRKLNCAPYATSARRMPAASHDRTAGAPTGHNREDHLLRPDSAKVTARSPQGHARTKQAELTDAPSERLVSHARPGCSPRAAQPPAVSRHSCPSSAGSTPAGFSSPSASICSQASTTRSGSTKSSQATRLRLAPPRPSKSARTSSTSCTEIPSMGNASIPSPSPLPRDWLASTDTDPVTPLCR